MLLGVHCSVSGGVHNAFAEAAALKIDAFQIFTKNQKQWKDPEFKPEVVEKFHAEAKASPVKIKFSHASYLLNLASSDEFIYNNSINSLIAELERCEKLGLDFTVFHPGYAKSITEYEAITNISKALKQVFEATKKSKVKVALENTAGQGTSIGGRFEHLKFIMEETESDRLGICIDTCHAFAAGYDIRTEQGFNDAFCIIDELVGLEKILALHLNDSKGELGSKLDRHAHIGQGKLGLEPFRQIMLQYPHKPKVLETPKEGNMDAVNLQLLRDLV